MKISVAPLEPAGEESWDAFVRERPGGRIYHTLAWRDATCDGLGHRPHYLKAVDADGEVVGVLPLFLVRGVFGRRLVSVPMRDRGGVLTVVDEAVDPLLRAAEELRDRMGCTHVELREVEPLPATELVSALALRRYWVNSFIDLTQGVDALWSGMTKKGGRGAVSRARKRGLEVRVENTEAAAQTFHRLLVRTRTDMGIPPYGLDFIRALFRHVIEPGLGRLAMIYKEGTPVNGLLSLMFGDRVYSAYAAPQNEYRGDNPSELAFWELMEWGASEGYARLELGADSPEQDGLIWFKSKLGASSEETYSYFAAREGKAPDLRDSSSGGFGLARRVWRRLPLGISARLGAWIARQMD